MLFSRHLFFASLKFFAIFLLILISILILILILTIMITIMITITITITITIMIMIIGYIHEINTKPYCMEIPDKWKT